MGRVYEYEYCGYAGWREFIALSFLGHRSLEHMVEEAFA